MQIVLCAIVYYSIAPRNIETACEEGEPTIEVETVTETRRTDSRRRFRQSNFNEKLFVSHLRSHSTGDSQSVAHFSVGRRWNATETARHVIAQLLNETT